MTETDRTHEKPLYGIDFDAASTASIHSIDSYGRKCDAPIDSSPRRTNHTDKARTEKKHVEGSRNYTPQNPEFLDSAEADPTYLSHFLNSDVTEEETSQKFNQSQKIPAWAWKVSIYVLGVTYNPKDKQSLLSRVIQIVTIVVALTFTVTGMVHEVFDIRSKQTKTSVVMGSVSIILGFMWICLGIYSQKLTSKLFSNRNFVECVRLHSRTFLKISVAGLFIFLVAILAGINCYESFQDFGPNHCDKLHLNRIVCHVMYASHVSFTIIAGIWNILVGCTLLSVCRTHTVVIRRFIGILDREARVLELISKENSRKFMRMTSAKSMDFVTDTDRRDSGWFIWDDFNHGSQYHLLDDQPLPEACNVRRNTGSNSIQVPEAQFESSITYEGCRENKSTILTNEEILNAYWKISKRMRITSRYLQRWLGSWIFFVIFWISDYIITWLTHEAQILGILECVLPLFILALLSSAFAEVNGEGQRMIRCICPTSERLKLLQFLTLQPLQMTVFNFTLNYNAIAGILLAFCIAFSSRLILDEIK